MENVLKFYISEMRYSPNSYLMHCREGESFLLYRGQILLEMQIHKIYGAIFSPKLLCSLF